MALWTRQPQIDQTIIRGKQLISDLQACVSDLLGEQLALCAAPRPSAPGPSTLVALSVARATFCHARAGARAVRDDPCGPKKTQENPIEVCPDNQKASLVIVGLMGFCRAHL